MLTSLGRFLRKLRIDKDEVLKDMADKLGVSASFLSAVENGKKHMPALWNTEICNLYELSNDEKEVFACAIAETEDTVDMNLAGVGLDSRKFAVSFARNLPYLSNEQVEAMKRIMDGKGTN